MIAAAVMLLVAPVAAAIAPFTTVDVAGDVTVDIAVHAAASGGDASYEETTGTGEVKLEVKDRVLVITAPPSSRAALKVKVVAPGLTQVRARFSSRVTVHGLDAKSFEASAADSAHLTLAGTCAQLKLFAWGSASIDAHEVANVDTRVILDRAARATVAPTGTLDAELKGASSLDVRSEPRRVNKKLSPAARLKLRVR